MGPTAKFNPREIYFLKCFFSRFLKGLNEIFLPPLTLFTLLLLTKNNRISLEFDASGTGFEAFFGGFLLVDTVLDFFFNAAQLITFMTKKS